MGLNPNRINGADAHLAGNLALCIINDGGQDEYWIGRLAYLVKSRALAGRAARGAYDPVMAGRAWRFVIEDYIPTYKHEMGVTGRIDVATRNLAGRLLEQYMREDVYNASGVPEVAFPARDAAVTAVEEV